MSRARKWFFICIPLVFIAGFLSGGFIAVRFGHHLFRPPGFGERGRHDPPPAFKTKMQAELLDNLSRDLSLNDSQKAQVKKILDANEAEFIGIRTEMRKTFDGFRDKTNSQIMAVLNDSQKEKFKKISNKFDEHP